jgi:hypothetical protein
MDMGEKLLKHGAADFCCMFSSFIASVDLTEFQSTEVY